MDKHALGRPRWRGAVVVTLWLTVLFAAVGQWVLLALADSEGELAHRLVPGDIDGPLSFLVLASFGAIVVLPARQGKGVSVSPFPKLTDREREVLDLIAEGLDNAQIASRLYISNKTISNHISNIFAKLHLVDRAQAIVAARDAGLGRRPSGLSPGRADG